MFWFIVSLITLLKLLFIKTYKSTDFEVHRNWLAITHSLPLKKWYIENTSEWTLDYPPLFAWFEYFLSQIAKFVDPKMLDVTNLGYDSEPTIIFQRLTVICTDFILAYGTKCLASYIATNPKKKSSKKNNQWHSPSTILQVFVLCNVGLLLVDHIHFQYNGVLFGILLISVDNYLMGAFWFSVLINMKHIFLYMAPAYFVYLLRNYCYCYSYDGKLNLKTFLMRVSKLGMIVTAVTAVSFGPFIYYGQTKQVLSRLFPFKRGLCHAYWAPNFWAIYNVIDKALIILAKLIGFNVDGSVGKMTSGLVQEYSHSILPQITPVFTLLLSVAFMLPCLWKLWSNPGNPYHFVRAILLCAYSAFLFGWHVHEKAILMIIIPQSILAVLWRKEAEFFILLTVTGHYALLPLIFTREEFLIKILLYLIYNLYVYDSLSDLFHIRLLGCYERYYIFGFLPLFLYENFIHSFLGLQNKYPFVPLLVTSFYCAAGVCYSFFSYYSNFLKININKYKQKTF